MPKWDGLLPPVSCGERLIIDGVRTPVAYSIPAQLLALVSTELFALAPNEVSMSRSDNSGGAYLGNVL